MASRKLWQYFQAHQKKNFQAHQVTMLTSYPLRHILQNQEGMGRMVKWAIELAEFGLRFAPRHAIKSQALTDFMAEWTPVLDVERLNKTASSVSNTDEPWILEYWCMNFDGSLILQGAGAKVVLTSPDR